MAHFFATADDLLPMLLSVEAMHAVVYTAVGYFHEPRADRYLTARDLPTLFRPQPFGSASSGPAYLITEADTEVVFRRVPTHGGGDRWSIDQLVNPDSTVLRHGGLFQEGVLLPGEIRTVSRTTISQRIQRAFDAAIRERFARVRAFYVGPAAGALLDSGCRLTSAEQSPPEYDLRR